MGFKLLARFSLVLLSLLLLPAASQAAPPNVTPDPLLVDFGQQSVDENTPTTNIKFQNLSGADIEVTGFSFSGTDPSQFQTVGNSCAPQTLTDGNSCTVDVFFRPGSVGNFSASADLTTDQGVESVPLTGEGAAGSLSGTAPSYTPQPYYFGSQFGSAQFQNTDQNFTVRSNNATITGPDAAFFSVGNDGCSNQPTQFPGNTCNVDVFFNPTGPGTKNAQLNLFNSGSPNPAVVPLTATALAGPMGVVIPDTIDFGNVGIGSSSSVRHVKIENQGDYVLQIQQIFVISGVPNFFPLTDDQCVGAMIAPGDSCGFDVAFVPGKTGTGPQNGSIFVITNAPGPITQSFLSGTGYEFPVGGSLTVGGEARALSTLSCDVSGFPAGTNYKYSWFRGSTKVASGRNYKVVNADIGKRMKCTVATSNPVGTGQAESPKTAVVEPASLVSMAGSLVTPRTCRALQAPASVGGASLSYGHPVTPADPLRVDGPGRTTVEIDGQTVGQSNGTVQVTPRMLSQFADGSHNLSIRGGGSSGDAGIVLSGCTLAASAVIHRDSTVLEASSSVGMNPVVFRAGKKTGFRPRRISGKLTFRALNHPSATVLLSGRRSRSNGVFATTATGKGIKVEGLPLNTGVVRLKLNRGSVSGAHFSVAATLKRLGEEAVRIRALRQR